ncbi:heme-binding-like protein [Hibiscus syriacus]|uniref:Heme-binding-like protein n=1 Tax=Hibiscus syriacus TaxID=106335 RepID=A0A6A3BUP2_HIBSY|nr:L-type lectin-domain containing receptor kinase VIII.1-like [Hibiscus syriacus]KAE8720566.1 heme-binding-like protein [Hibiscus syriacus]
MATFFISSYRTALICLVSFFKILAAEQSSSFSFKSFGKDPKFESNIALYGDSRAGNDGSWIQLTDSVSWSAGAVMYKKPIKLVEGKAMNFTSFSTYFSFSMSHGNGDGLAFIMVPSSFKVDVLGNSSFGVSLGLDKSKSGIVAVVFDTLKDDEHGDLSENHVGIDVGSLASVKARNLSSLNLELNNGEKLHCWIDYEATSKRFEIRLSQSSSSRPNDPLLTYSINLSKLWNGEVFVGLSSANGNSSQTCFIHSWSFKLRQVPNWMHSQPLDPKAAVAKKPEPLTAKTKSSRCFWKVFVVFVFGGACGALMASCVMYAWNVFGDRRPVVPEECGVDPMDFDYKVKVVVVDDAVKDGKKQIFGVGGYD